GQSHREVTIAACPACLRVFAQVITDAPRNGSVLLANYNGIGRAGDDGSVPEGAESFVDVVDDRFDRAISHVGHNRLVDRGHMKDVQWLAGFVHWFIPDPYWQRPSAARSALQPRPAPARLGSPVVQ